MEQKTIFSLSYYFATIFLHNKETHNEKWDFIYEYLISNLQQDDELLDNLDTSSLQTKKILGDSLYQIFSNDSEQCWKILHILSHMQMLPALAIFSQDNDVEIQEKVLKYLTTIEHQSTLDSLLIKSIERLKKFHGDKDFQLLGHEIPLILQDEIVHHTKQKILPTHNPKNVVYEIVGDHQYTADQFVGNYYNFFKRENRQAFVFGEGHSDLSMSAVLIIVKIVSFLQAQLYQSKGKSISEIMTNVNSLFKENSERHQYMALFYGELDSKNVSLHYCNAGVGYAFFYCKKNNTLESLCSGIVLGLKDKCQYEEKKILLNKGDILIFCSDDFDDIVDFEEKSDVFKETICNNCHKSAEEIILEVRNVLKEIRASREEPPMFGEETILVIKVK